MLLDADKIRSAGRQTEKLDVPEWGGEVVIQELSLAELKKVSKAVDTDDEDATRLLLRFGVKEPAMDKELLDAILNDGGAKAVGRVTGAISGLQARVDAETEEDREASF